MKILVVGARGIPNVEGGAEKNAEKIFPRIVEMGDTVHLFCVEPGDGSDEYLGVKLIRAPRLVILGTDKLAYYLYAPFYALKFRPDIVHFQGLGSAILLWLYKLFGVRTVVRYGSADYLVGKWGFLGRLGFRWAEWQLRLADKVVSVTPALADRLKENGIARNVVVIGNALDPVEPGNDRRNMTKYGLSGKKFILSVGRVTAQKDFLSLIKAFKRARSAGVALDRLVIVGGTDDAPYLEELKPHLTDEIILTGRLPRGSFSDLLDNCAIFVNSSMHEGHSNAVLEAVSHKCPLIVSDIPENRDLPLPAHNFFVCGDDKDLAKRLDEALNEPDKFVADRKKFLNWNDVARQTRALYQENARL